MTLTSQIVQRFLAQALSWNSWPIRAASFLPQYRHAICSILAQALSWNSWPIRAASFLPQYRHAICSIVKRERSFMAALSFQLASASARSWPRCRLISAFAAPVLTAVRQALRSCAISSQCLLLLSAAWRCRFVQSM